jgi:hypothetical protein
MVNVMNQSTTIGVSRRRGARGFATVVAALGLGLAGCTAEVETAHPVVVTDDEAVVEAETVPAADVYAYPRTEYRGHAVYYVNGRWYYPRGRHWYYYRTEPTELQRHRRYIQQAPPAPRNYDPHSDEAVRVR